MTLEPCTFSAEQMNQLRENLKTIEAYFSMTGQDRARRWELYCEDCKSGGGERVLGHGLAQQKELELRNAKDFPDWAWRGNVYLFSDDPNYIVVQNTGFGTCMLGKDAPTYQESPYFHSFTMEGGKIKEYQEHMLKVMPDMPEAAEGLPDHMNTETTQRKE